MKKITIAAVAVLYGSCFFLLNGCGKSEQQKQQDCIANAKQIMLALTMYADDHRNILPDDLTQLSGGNYLPAETLVCPAAKKGESCTYEFLAWGKKLSQQKTGVFICRRHPGVTIVGCPDGHIETVTGELPALLTPEGAKKAAIAEIRSRCSALSTQLRLNAVRGKQSTGFRRLVYGTPCPKQDADEESWKDFSNMMVGISADMLKEASDEEFKLYGELLGLLERYEKLRNK